MKKIAIASFILFAIFSACKKSSDSSRSQGTAELKATINDTVITFNIETATLIRSVADNQKRMDISAISKDGTTVLIMAIGEETATGNGLTVGDHVVRLFNQDNPDTPQDESVNSDCFMNLAFYVGNSLISDTYSENGNIHISSCDENSAIVSGTFQASLNSLNSGTNYTITDGSFSNVKYIVEN